MARALTAAWLCIAAWAFGGDYCLLHAHQAAPFAFPGMFGFGILVQLAALVAMGAGIWGRAGYFHLAHSAMSSTRLKAGVVVVPLVLLTLSHSLVAEGIFGSATDAQGSPSHRDSCHAQCSWTLACG